MENTTLIIAGMILTLVVVIVILSLIISSLRKKNARIISQAQSDVASARATCENEKRVLNAKHAEEIDSIRLDCARQIQHVKEDIENDREVLFKMNEKELIANVMIALNGYGNRLDRIEQNLADDQITERIIRLFQDVAVKINNSTNTLTEQIDDIKREISSIEDAVDEIYSSISDKYSYDSLAFNIDNIRIAVNDVKDAIEFHY